MKRTNSSPGLRMPSSDADLPTAALKPPTPDQHSRDLQAQTAKRIKCSDGARPVPGTRDEQLQLAAGLRTQLACWLRALRGYGPCCASATDNELTVLAMETFARFLSTAAGRVYLQEHRRFHPALAAALWTAVKFMCGRGQSPGASLLQHVTGVPSKTLVSTEWAIVKATGWKMMEIARATGVYPAPLDADGATDSA